VSERGRRRAFIWATAFVGGAATLVIALEARPRGEVRQQAPRSAAVVAGGSDAQKHVGARPGAPTDRSSLAEARETARLFVRAFLSYQRGDTSSHIAMPLARTASAPVRRYLGSAAPRLPGTVHPASVRALRLYGPQRGSVKASALLAYGRRTRLFEFVLEREERGWRVTELYP
jgi:hypothetical protein